MTHLDDERLYAWIDSNLSENERQAVEEHLEECTFCKGNAEELGSLFRRLERLPKSSVSKSTGRKILKTFRAVKKTERHPVRSIPGCSAVMAGVIAGILLGYLISPFLQAFSGTGLVLYTDNNTTVQGVNDDYYLQRLLTDNGGDLW
jgi:anti-sigma factor RsiW